ncbi:hypothetical protein [Neomegalonema sp.]|uniref:ATP-grasp domain-containing protein n=1 Tax=Neomegalonema sp. TaxID=2039713 RepID=UPI00263A10C9|nr:hypothetical protein [Neomegalonema sp.]MDD2868137.1 hypothetical protein [Neomegalonema sp.]
MSDTSSGAEGSSRVLMFVGGGEDPQLRRLAEAAHARGIGIAPMITLDEGPRGVLWRLGPQGAEAMTDERGEPLKAHAAFLRQDVFRYLRTSNDMDNVDARAWRVLMEAWLAANPQVRRFNQRFFLKDSANKPFALIQAQRAGLQTPRTLLTALASELRAWARKEEVVYKPIDGGDHCRVLTVENLEMYGDGVLPRPYIFQERLVAPEIRIFRVGPKFFAFRVESPSLDYRENQDAQLTPVEPPAELLPGLTQVSDELGLNFCAADFKTRASDGALCFMEINSNPMFAGFDMACGGALCAGMLDVLMGDEPI